MNTPNQIAETEPDALLIGAGIMSATLAVFLKELQPDLNIMVVEKLESAAQESSNAWNNAGTGHAALCVLVRKVTADKVLPAMAAFGGRVLHTNLTREQEDKLQEGLRT